MYIFVDQKAIIYIKYYIMIEVVIALRKFTQPKNFKFT